MKAEFFGRHGKVCRKQKLSKAWINLYFVILKLQKIKQCTATEMN